MPCRYKIQYIRCYDIRCPRRLQRLHRYLCRHAIPVQYSVFYGVFTRTELDDIKDGIQNIINPRQDDIRIYPLPTHPGIITLGQSLFPEGVSILDENAPDSFFTAKKWSKNAQK